jgi:hypothetical protein
MLLGSSVTGFQPLPLVRGFPWITAITYATDEINVAWQMIENPTSTRVVFYASAPFSTGINHVDMSRLRFLAEMEVTGSTGSMDLYDAYVARFNPCIGESGLRALFAVKAVNSDNFAASKRAPFLTTLQCEFTTPCGTFDFTFDDSFS